jgi:uridine phosphorylase
MNIISETELILNNNGSVYHLNLLPEDISDTILHVGDPDRVQMVASFFQKIEVKKQKREFITITGSYNGKRITVISTGIGTDNIDIVYNELDALVNINLKTRTIKETLTALKLIRIGTSGSLQEEIEPDAFVFSKYGLGLDGLLHYYKLKNTDEEKNLVEAFRKSYSSFPTLPLPYLASCSEELEKKLSGEMRKGITVSCPGFYAPQGRQLRYELMYPELIDHLTLFGHNQNKITNFEMETSAMYALASILGHHCASVNLIVANRITKQFSPNYEKALMDLIALTLEKVTA